MSLTSAQWYIQMLFFPVLHIYIHKSEPIWSPELWVDTKTKKASLQKKRAVSFKAISFFSFIFFTPFYLSLVHTMETIVAFPAAKTGHKVLSNLCHLACVSAFFSPWPHHLKNWGYSNMKAEHTGCSNSIHFVVKVDQCINTVDLLSQFNISVIKLCLNIYFPLFLLLRSFRVRDMRPKIPPMHHILESCHSLKSLLWQVIL